MSRRPRSNERKRSPLSRAERERRIKTLIELGYIERASEVPEGAIPATTTVPTRSWYSLPTPFYADEVFRCRKCGKATVWTALEKFQYYERDKGNMYAKWVRCQTCYDTRRWSQRGRGHRECNGLLAFPARVAELTSEVIRQEVF